MSDIDPQADRFADFMADSIKHGPPIATGTVRRNLDEHAVNVGRDVVRFADGSEIARSECSLDAPRKSLRR
jgi:hypothetical protein